MVKRAKSPEAADDDKYFTVYQPYPLNANWELPADYITFSRWIASCIGMEPLHALHYKPSARGMVLIEIDKKYPHNDRLLGEHRWSDFLRKPSAEEKGKVSQIFHCLYDTGRAAQKDGWKRIHVEAAWFKDWSPINAVIQNPYPVTFWCPVPPEDKTNKPLCRHLPVKVKPPPARIAPPVVGSASWADAKADPSQDPAQAARGAWTSVAKKGSAKNKTVKPTVNTQPARSAWSKPIIENKPSVPPVTTSSTTPIPSPLSGVNVQAPAFPPGLTRGRPPHMVPPGLDRTSGSGSSGSSSGGQLSSPDEEIAEPMVTIAMSPSQTAAFYGEYQPIDFETAYVAPWEQVEIDDEGSLWDTGERAGEYKVTGGEVVESLWGDEDEVAKKKKADVILCPVHGIICKKGICKEYAKILKEEEKKKREREREAEGKSKRNNGPSWRRTDNGKAKATDNDGFSTVSGRKGRANGASKKWGDSDRSGSATPNAADEDAPAIGRMRGYSNSSVGESIATASESGWDKASAGPWNNA